MKKLAKISMILGVSTFALAACDPADQGFIGWNTESGRELNEGNFGNPTLNNTLVQAAYAEQSGLILDLSRKFAKDVPSMINFEFNRSALDAEAKSILARQADWIRQFPNIRFRVYGHTDLVGSRAANQRLGMRRARTALNYLVSRGVARGRLEAVASFGETQPLIVTENPERRNRRTVTEVIGFTRNFVGDDLDGKYAMLIYQQYIAGGSVLTGETITE